VGSIAQSVQRITTGWTVRGSNPDGGEIFRTCPDRLCGPPSLLYKEYRVFPGGKSAGAWRWPPTPSSAEVKERVELYLYSPSEPYCPVLGCPLPSPYCLWNSKLITCFPADVIWLVRFLLGNFPTSEFYMPTFRNTLFHLHRQVGK
jgi:hypothetical protein